VVGQRHDEVAPRGEPGGAVQPADLAVDVAEHTQGVPALDAREVRHLVVADEVGVHRGPPGEHVLQHRGHDDVAGDDVRPGPDEAETEPPGHPRPHVRAGLAGGVAQLAEDLADGADERAQHVHRVREVAE
jgi:hypothetical protein